MYYNSVQKTVLVSGMSVDGDDDHHHHFDKHTNPSPWQLALMLMFSLFILLSVGFVIYFTVKHRVTLMAARYAHTNAL
jgi:hypothetical protein